MRVIAGDAKGTRLETPKGEETRPTLDRVREALFSILGPKLEGARFLDLYAGTGAIGIEALSRGAAYCEFIENDAQCAAILHRNLAAARVESRASIRRLHLPDQLAEIHHDEAAFDLIYADPPFKHAQYQLVCDEITRHGLLKPEGVLIIEHHTKQSVPAHTQGLIRYRESNYGATTLSFFSFENGESDGS